MTTSSLWPWLALLGLGAAHGINPGMGWLFAVALGLQEQKRAAVWRAIACLALGHALAIAVVVAAAAALGFVLPFAALKWLIAAALLALGVTQLVRHAHPRYGGMSVGARQLTIWSFLMATAHGAGLMVLPLVLRLRNATTPGHAPAAHAGSQVHAHAADGALLAGVPHAHAAAILATLVHTAGYLLITAVIAVIVYEKLGLRMLRYVWINVRVIWAVALIVTALLTPLIG